MYFIIRPILFRMDPEKAHEWTLQVLNSVWGRSFAKLHKVPRHSRLHRLYWGIHFRNPLGLAAGMDKNAYLLPLWDMLGFGFVEIGTVTPRPQEGNPKPRLFRLPLDKALINRLGFNNDGAAQIAHRLEYKPDGLVVGVNIGKNKDTPLDKAVNDYLACLMRFYDLADYFTINVSSPNTPDLRLLEHPFPLKQLLEALQNAVSKQKRWKPIFIKISPDISMPKLHEIIAVAKQAQIAGIVATNTTTSRENLKTPTTILEKIGEGGLSGAPLFAKSNSIISEIDKANIPVIGVGGIFSGQDAVEKIQAGAALIQIYTGLIYRGPSLIREILKAPLPHKYLANY
ncbi:MAG: quinone-dependent dihydroorotate dehydrogenase [Bacteroidia bacterium]|nr:quinone-dependent dihydroorotate dehydrogenase [Bacteroidia bacterium]